MVRLGPALLAPTLTQGSLDPQMLFHTGAPHDGRFDGIALGVHQDSIHNQTQKLVTQRHGLLIPPRAEISQKGPHGGHLGSRERASGHGRVQLREILEALPPPVDLFKDDGDMLWRTGQGEVLL